MSELSQVKGINARQIKLLQENGISTAEALAMSSSTSISEIEGMGEKTAKKLIWNARSALGMTEFVVAEDIDENVEYITTGSSELNRILGGGIPTTKLTEVFGPFKSGKTNLAHTLSVTAQLPRSKGGLEGSVAYIDTENTFSKEKIARIAKRFGLNSTDVLSKIFHARIYSSDHQAQMIAKAESLCKTRNVKLVVLDSLIALMRVEYVGIGQLAKRQGVLNNMIHALSRIAETYNCAVLVTNQVATKMMGLFSADDAIGGNIVAHGCHIRMMFKTKGFSSNSSLLRRAIIVDAPDLPPEECEFYITSTGIADSNEAGGSEASESGLEEESFYEENEPENTSDQIEGSVSLTEVKGIGENTAKKLESAGINTVERLLNANPDEVSKINGLSPKKITEMQENAKRLIKV
jgi:transcription termination factor NusA